MQSMPINLPNGYKKPINRRSFQRKRVRKNHLKSSEEIVLEISAQKEALLPWRNFAASTTRWSKSLGGPPPRFPLFFYPTWPRCCFSARLLGFLLDIRPSLGLCPLKIRGPSQPKWTKASSVFIWRTMVESIHDSRPSIWTSPHNRLRSQIPLSSLSIVFCILKETKITILVFHHW